MAAGADGPGADGAGADTALTQHALGRQRPAAAVLLEAARLQHTEVGLVESP
jgi:hypothetical protein